MAPSGEQVEIAHGDDRVTVVEVGGGVRSWTRAGVAVLDGYGADEMVTAARGQPLVPWPNRLHGGSYTWDGREIAVPLDEPEQGNALHGVCRYRTWQLVERTADAVTSRLLLHPSPPYPFTLDVQVRWALGADGLTVTTTATNVGESDAPWALGFHPYLRVTDTVDEADLTVPAQTWLPTDDDQIPTGRQPVEGSAYDFRGGRRIGDQHVDQTLTDLQRDGGGRATARLASPDGKREVALWVDESFPYLEVFTADTVPQPGRRRQGLGLEPMTAPPNAFVTGEDLRRLRPGDTARHVWGITVLR